MWQALASTRSKDVGKKLGGERALNAPYGTERPSPPKKFLHLYT